MAKLEALNYVAKIDIAEEIERTISSVLLKKILLRDIKWQKKYFIIQVCCEKLIPSCESKFGNIK